jgi:hypothetical protein
MKNLILLTALLASVTGCKKETFPPPAATVDVDPNEPQLEVHVVRASFAIDDAYNGGSVTADVIKKCSTPPVIGHCDYAPKCNPYSLGPFCNAPYKPGYSSRFTATYTCGTSPTLYYVTLGDNAISPPTAANEAGGKIIRLSCSGKTWDSRPEKTGIVDPSKVITIVSATLADVTDKPTTDLKQNCNNSIGKCNYYIEGSWLFKLQTAAGVYNTDPYPGRSKRITVNYKCGTTDMPAYQFGQNDLPPTPANNADGKTIALTCP